MTKRSPSLAADQDAGARMRFDPVGLAVPGEEDGAVAEAEGRRALQPADRDDMLARRDGSDGLAQRWGGSGGHGRAFLSS